MTGRGDGRILRSFKDPKIRIGITLTTLPTLYPSDNTTSLWIILTAHILTTPHPNLPISLCTFRNPFSNLSNMSFKNISCIYPSTSRNQHKFIEIYPRAQWPQYVFDSDNLADYCEFLTIPSLESGRTVSVTHEVPTEKVEEARLQIGEKYKVELCDKCLGTIWWRFGEMPEGQGVKIKSWLDPKSLREEWEEAQEKDGAGVYRGEQPGQLALVDEGDGAVFEAI